MTDSAALSPRRQATRQKLLDAAVRIFAERGVLAATVEEICDEAGFTRGAFYSNFGSKDDLILALMDDVVESDLAATEQAIAGIRSGIATDDLDSLVSTAVDVFLESQHTDRERILVNVELRLYAARRPAVRDAYNSFFDQFGTLFSSELVPIMERGGFRLTVPVRQALGLIKAVFEESQLGILLGRDSRADSVEMRDDLITLLKGMTTRRDDATCRG